MTRASTVRLTGGAEAGDLRPGYERLSAPSPNHERSPHAIHPL
ncbi:hypothetical protein [Pseudoramibacter faecis]|nr:hypothetical protein [Pseudoramibacter sp. HA2172]